MLIQNTGNIAQAPQPTRPASDGVPNVAVAPPSSNSVAQPSVSLELPQVAAKPATETQPTARQLQNMVDSINRTLKQSNKNLEFTVDEETKKQVVKLVDTETGDLIRQFPSEEMLAISRAIDQLQQGVLLKQEA